MNIKALIGRKIDQTQGFLDDGTRVPLTIISVGQNTVTQVKMEAREGYNAIQLGFGMAKRLSKPMAGHIKKAGQTILPRFFREVRVDETPNIALGSAIGASEILEPGDIVDVEGISKGKGFAGVVKRHGFHGGPRTHGQSDRERAPGSIGQTTTPGRVYKGKKMAGRMGNAKVTVKNLEILDIQSDTIYVKGLIPGSRGSLVRITKVGRNKKFVPLYSEHSESSENSDNQTVGESDVSENQNVQIQTEVSSGDEEKGEEVSSDAKALEDKEENAG